MFYSRLKLLCDEKGISPTKACSEIGISKGTLSYWKNTDGFVPKNDILRKIALYFDVSTEYLSGNSDLRNPIQVSEIDELTEYLEELRTRSELRMLFSVAKGATKEDVEKVVEMFKIMKGEFNG